MKYDNSILIKEWTDLLELLPDEFVREIQQLAQDDPRKYHVFLPNKMLMVEKGADASAEFLLALIKMNKVTPAEAVKRYKEVYKL